MCQIIGKFKLGVFLGALFRLVFTRCYLSLTSHVYIFQSFLNIKVSCSEQLTSDAIISPSSRSNAVLRATGVVVLE